jgi:hypothetical protein
MKKLAAHNFEDLLQVPLTEYVATHTLRQVTRQCALPVLEGLLPVPHNDAILDLVFVMGCWHAYAKLRLHTEHTLASFERLTADLGTLLRHFATVTCEAFRTMELPRECAARQRRTAADPMAKASRGGAKAKTFNLRTYKIHALGDYPKTIRERGTTDNYNSQRVRDLTPNSSCLRPDLHPPRSSLSIAVPKQNSRISTIISQSGTSESCTAAWSSSDS